MSLTKSQQVVDIIKRHFNLDADITTFIHKAKLNYIEEKNEAGRWGFMLKENQFPITLDTKNEGKLIFRQAIEITSNYKISSIIYADKLQDIFYLIYKNNKLYIEIKRKQGR